MSFIVKCRLPIGHHNHNWRVPTATFEYDLINWIYRYVWKSRNVPDRDANDWRYMYLSWQLLNHCLCFVIFQEFLKTSKHKLPVEYGNWLKHRQTKTPTTKTSTDQNVESPKRRRTEISTDQNVDKPKRQQTKTSTDTSTLQNVWITACTAYIQIVDKLRPRSSETFA